MGVADGCSVWAKTPQVESVSLMILFLLLVIVLPLALSAGVSYGTLPRGCACPVCRSETLGLVAPWLTRCSRLLRGTDLQHRWCMSCGWDGIARILVDGTPLSPSRLLR